MPNRSQPLADSGYRLLTTTSFGRLGSALYLTDAGAPSYLQVTETSQELGWGSSSQGPRVRSARS